MFAQYNPRVRTKLIDSIRRQHLAHALAVGETHHVRQAAERCGVTPSTITRSVQHVEAAHELRLFKRTAAGMTTALT